MKNYVLMTATVTPPTGETVLTRIDPALRLNDYIEAFNYYLSDALDAIDGLIFVDNSNHPLDEIKLLAHQYSGPKKIEIISFYGLDYPIEYNRGYGELKLIEHAFKHSKLMRDMAETDRFWKVTGRLKVITLNRIIKIAPDYFELCADFRMRRNQVDTRLIAFNIIGYKKYIYGRLHEMPGLIIESWLYKKLVPLLGTKAADGIETEFRAVAKFDGFAGYKSANYMAPKQQLIYFVRSVYLNIKYFFKS